MSVSAKEALTEVQTIQFGLSTAVTDSYPNVSLETCNDSTDSKRIAVAGLLER